MSDVYELADSEAATLIAHAQKLRSELRNAIDELQSESILKVRARAIHDRVEALGAGKALAHAQLASLLEKDHLTEIEYATYRGLITRMVDIDEFIGLQKDLSDHMLALRQAKISRRLVARLQLASSEPPLTDAQRAEWIDRVLGWALDWYRDDCGPPPVGLGESAAMATAVDSVRTYLREHEDHELDADGVRLVEAIVRASKPGKPKKGTPSKDRLRRKLLGLVGLAASKSTIKAARRARERRDRIRI